MIWVNNKGKEKVYPSYSYIYNKESYEHDNGLTSMLPYINVKGEEVSEINNRLLTKYYEIITVDEEIMLYEHFYNDGVLSLVVKIYYKDTPGSIPNDVLVYNIDIKSGEIIYNDVLFNLFNTSSSEVSDIIVNKIKDYYNYEISKGYIDKDCDFNCYLSNTNSLPALNNTNFYIKDNALMAYKTILLDSEFFYDDNSGFDLFNFEIKEK